MGLIKTYTTSRDTVLEAIKHFEEVTRNLSNFKRKHNRFDYEIEIRPEQDKFMVITNITI